MKTTVKHISDTRVLVTVTLEKLELDEAQQSALKKLAKTIKVAGFRKGHVPLDVVAKNIEPNTLSAEVLDRALNRAVAESFIGNKLQALEQPQVDVKKFVPGELLEFTAEADVLPEVKLGDYKKLKAKREVAPVTQADVDEVVERIRGGFSEKKPRDGAAEMGDETVIDFVGKMGGEAFDGGTAKDYALTLGSNSFIPGFEEAIVGHKVDETFDVPLAFPKDYHAKHLAGQEVVFTVTLHQVNVVELPKLSDEFAAKVGPYTSIDDLYTDIKAEITARNEKDATDQLKDELVRQLVTKSKVSVPEVLVGDQIQSIEQDMTQNLMYQGMSFEQYLETKGYASRDEWIEKEAREAAEDRIKAGMVLAELSRAEQIEVTPDELTARIDEFKKQYAKNPEMAKRFDEPEVQRDIANRIVTEKTVDALVVLNTK